MKRSRTKNSALICVLGAALSFVLVACSSQASVKSVSSTDNSTGYELINEGKLTVAAALDFPPFESIQEDKTIGFSVELIGLLTEEMGLELDYLPSMRFDTIIASVVVGSEADVGVSSLTITAERIQEVDFTDPYYDVNQSLVVLKDSSFSSVDDFAKKKIGVQAGTTGFTCAGENIKKADIVSYDETTALFTALRKKQIDGIVIDMPVAQYAVKNEYPDVLIMQEFQTGEQYGITVNKENPKLTAALNSALEAIKSNGKYDELCAKYFG